MKIQDGNKILSGVDIMTNTQKLSKEDIEQIKKWKAVAEHFDLESWELREVIFHLDRIMQLIDKK